MPTTIPEANDDWMHLINQWEEANSMEMNKWWESIISKSIYFYIFYKK